MTDANGMTPLPSHQAFEDMLRPRGNRPSAHIHEATYAPWVVVCFSAKWCGPCQKLNKKWIVAKTPGVQWYSCDVDENDITLGYCSLKGIPGFCIIKDGMFKDKKQGAANEDDVLSWLVHNGVPVPIV